MGSIKGFAAAIVAALFLAVAAGMQGDVAKTAAQEEPLSVEPFAWRFNEDYPGSVSDADAPIDVVYIKTHDGTDWMSRWESNKNVVSGPDALRRIIGDYESQGIPTIAWFVPNGTDYQAQIDYAKAVLDAGVDGLYADIEPYDGFCNNDCGALAENFWKPLRAERPDAVLGVIYDPRPQHWDSSAVQSWFSVADVALPMCYWDTFSGQDPWGDPRGCIEAAAADLPGLAGGRHIEYVPIVQGDTSPEKMKQGIESIKSLGLNRLRIWRRGLVSAEVWTAINEATPPPATVVSGLPDVTKMLAQIENLRGKSPRSLAGSVQLFRLIERAAELGLHVT